MPSRVIKIDRVVEHVGVSVPVAGIAGLGNDGICLRKVCQNRIVPSGDIIHQFEVIGVGVGALPVLGGVVGEVELARFIGLWRADDRVFGGLLAEVKAWLLDVE